MPTSWKVVPRDSEPGAADVKEIFGDRQTRRGSIICTETSEVSDVVITTGSGKWTIQPSWDREKVQGSLFIRCFEAPDMKSFTSTRESRDDLWKVVQRFLEPLLFPE